MKKVILSMAMVMVMAFNLNTNATTNTNNSVDEVVGTEFKVNTKKIQINVFETKELPIYKKLVKNSNNQSVKELFTMLLDKYEKSGLNGKIFYMNKIISMNIQNI